MGAEQEIGDSRLGHQLGMILETALRMLTDIGIGPAIERTVDHLGEIVGDELIAQPVALIDHRP